MRTPLTVAAAQPACTGGDVAANARRHAEVVRDAQAQVVVFPELSLTGYELAAPAVSPDDPVLEPLVDACRAAGAVALAGAPVQDGDRAFIAMLRVDADGVRVTYRKSWLGGREADRFAPGDGPAVIDLDGWRIGLGICKDTGSARHVAGVAALEVDAYLAGLVHLPAELPEQEARAVVIARALGAYVVFASFAGPTGDVFSETAGCSAIYSPLGLAVSRAGPGVGEVARATLR